MGYCRTALRAKKIWTSAGVPGPSRRSSVSRAVDTAPISEKKLRCYATGPGRGLVRGRPDRRKTNEKTIRDDTVRMSLAEEYLEPSGAPRVGAPLALLLAAQAERD